MANPTTNFGWVMPTSTSLVTNLPADFNTFGQAVDTSMSELLGGTTGQVLSKTSNTNMDFTWVTPTDQTPLTTKGDLFTFSTVDARLAVGTNGQTLVADSSTATGLKWATPATAASSWVKIVQTSFSGVSSQTFDNCFTGTYKHYAITLDGIYGSNNAGDFLYQARTSAPATISTNYYGGNLKLLYNSSTPTNITHNAATAITITEDIGDSVQPAGGILFVTISGTRNTFVQGFYGNANSATGNSPIVSTDGGGSGGQAGFILSVTPGTMTGRVTVYGVTE